VLRFNKHGPWETCTSVQSPNFASVGPGAIQPGCGHLHCTMQVAADCPDSRLAPQLPSRGCVRDKLRWTIHASECILVKGFGLSTLRCISDVDFCKHLVKGNKHGVRCSFVIWLWCDFDILKKSNSVSPVLQGCTLWFCLAHCLGKEVCLASGGKLSSPCQCKSFCFQLRAFGGEDGPNHWHPNHTQIGESWKGATLHCQAS
jgi:hypothetical protein